MYSWNEMKIMSVLSDLTLHCLYITLNAINHLMQRKSDARIITMMLLYTNTANIEDCIVISTRFLSQKPMEF